MSELKWPSEEEVRKMFAKKEGFGSDATLSAAMELPEVKALVEAARSVNHDNLHGNGLESFRKHRDRLRVTLENLDAALAAIKEPKT